MYYRHDARDAARIAEQMADLKDAIDYAYRRGLAAGTVSYAVWENGEEFVGVMRQPLTHALGELGLERKDVLT